MKLCLCVILLCIMTSGLYSYMQGFYEKTFIDPNRNNRQILTWIYYPIDNENPAAVFPYYIFGHGWTGNCTYYTTFTNALTNLGFIIAYPRTEEGYFVNTEALALDMVFLKEALYLETLNFSSPLYTKIDTLAIVGGYSMGGACAVAASYYEPDYASLITLAAAPRTWLNLYPSSINMALQVEASSITFSGSDDTVAPPSTNQIPIYNNLVSDYKSFISFTGQVHENFYNNPLIPSILEPWLAYIKTRSLYYLDAYESLLASFNSTQLTYSAVNNLQIILDTPENVLCNIDSNNISISWDRNYDAQGYQVYASDSPFTGFTDVTNTGTTTIGQRVVWNSYSPMETKRFYFIKAIRN